MIQQVCKDFNKEDVPSQKSATAKDIKGALKIIIDIPVFSGVIKNLVSTQQNNNYIVYHRMFES